ncbi:hypothetical protein GEMRC1_011448 [Eukaryota sp. GEM-RC1]
MCETFCEYLLYHLTSFSLSFLLMERFSRLAQVGEGTYGVVWKVRNKQTGEIFAIKRIRLESEEEGVPCTALREISLLKELQHDNVVQLFEVIYSHRKLALVFEFVDADLRKYMEARRGLSMTEVRNFLYQLLRGTAYIHSRKVLHRDLKPQNLLIDTKSGTLKLADFGLARAFGVPVRFYTHEVVTLWYRSLDVLLGSRTYDTAIDMWSIGCIFAEMVNGRPLFPGANDGDEVLKIFKILGTPSVQDYPELEQLPEYKPPLPFHPGRPLESVCPRLDAVGIHLLRSMLQYDPSKRISAKDALRHPFFKSNNSTVSKI